MKNTFEFIGQNGGSATVEQLTGQFPAPSGKKFCSKYDLTEKEMHAYYYENQRKIWEAQEFFEKQGIDHMRNLHDR